MRLDPLQTPLGKRRKKVEKMNASIQIRIHWFSRVYIWCIPHSWNPSWNLGNGSEWVYKNIFGPSRTCFWKKAILPRLNEHNFEMYQNRWKISGNFLDPLGENLDIRFNYTPKCMVSSMNFQNFSGEELIETPSQTPPHAQSQALPSILGRFASWVRAASSIHPSNMSDTPVTPNRGVLDQTLFSPNPNFLPTPFIRPNISFLVGLIEIYQWKYPWRQAGRIFWKSSVMNASYWNIQYSELFAPEAFILVQNIHQNR